MTNGHIEIYDPIPRPAGRSTGTYHDPESTPDVANMEDTVEFRVLMAYATRRRPNTQRSLVRESGGDDSDGHVKTPLKTPTQTENKLTEKKNRKKGRRLKRMLSIFSCTRPQTKNEEDYEEEQQKPMEPADEVSFRCFPATGEENKGVALDNTTISLADNVHHSFVYKILVHYHKMQIKSFTVKLMAEIH